MAKVTVTPGYFSRSCIFKPRLLSPIHHHKVRLRMGILKSKPVHHRPSSWEWMQLENDRLRRTLEQIQGILGTRSTVQTMEKIRELKETNKQFVENEDLLCRMKRIMERLENKIEDKMQQLLTERDINKRLTKRYAECIVEKNATIKLYEEYRKVCDDLRDMSNHHYHNARALRHKYFVSLADMSQLRSKYIDLQAKHHTLCNTTNELTCRICLQNRISTCLLPCRHSNFCASCIQGLFDHADSRCPVCRTTIESLIPLRI